MHSVPSHRVKSKRRFEAEPAQALVTEATGEDEALAGQETSRRKKSTTLSSRARYCLTCKGLKRDGPRHQHDNPSHKLRFLTAEKKRTFGAQVETEQTRATTFTFGKYKGKTFAWVKENAPSYFMWVWRERDSLFKKYSTLQQSPVTEGIFSEEVLAAGRDHEKAALHVGCVWFR